MNPWQKQSFSISKKDSKRIVEALEFCGDWDKTEIYYKLSAWLREEKEK